MYTYSWITLLFDFPGGSDSKESAYNAVDPGLIPGSGRSPGEGNGNPLQCSCLENPMDGGAWWATIHGVAKSRTQLSNLTSLHFVVWQKQIQNCEEIILQFLKNCVSHYAMNMQLQHFPNYTIVLCLYMSVYPNKIEMLQGERPSIIHFYFSILYNSDLSTADTQLNFSKPLPFYSWEPGNNRHFIFC